MSSAAPAIELLQVGPRHRFGLKGPGAVAWLRTHGIAAPEAPNTWARRAVPGRDTGPLVARLGSAEFFLEDAAGETSLRAVEPRSHDHPAGVYPVLRQDAAFLLCGERVHDALAQVCNVNFAEVGSDARPVIMTSMVGVSVLVIPTEEEGARHYRIWCDPTFGAYLRESLETVVIECGGIYRGGVE